MTLLTVGILMILQFVVTFEMTMVMPLAPIIAETYAVLPANVALLNLGFAASGLLSPIFGYLADYFSMKRILQFSTLLFSIGCLIVYTNTLTGYILGRLILGIGYFNLSSIIMSYTSLIVDTRKLGSIAGLYKIAFALGAFASPAIGGWIAVRLGFRSIYLLLAILGIAGVFSLQLLPEKKVEAEIPLRTSDAFALLTDKKALLMIAANFFLSIPGVYFYNYLSVHLAERHVSQANISVFYSTVAFGSIIAGILIMLFSDRVGKRKMSIGSTALSGLFLIPFLVTKNPLLLAGFLFGLAYDTIWGLFYPAGSTFYRTKSATFLTILGSVTSLTTFFSNATAPMVYEKGGFALLVVICAVGLLLSAFLMKWAFQLDNEDQTILEK